MQAPNSDDTSQQASRRHLRILCAEDHPSLQQLLLLVLTRSGHSVEIASDGMHALAKAVSDINAFDLVITDHDMPRLDGLGLVRQLRSADYPGKIIVLSSPLSHADRQAYAGLSVDRFLSKPVRNDALLQAIEEITRNSTNEA